MLPIALAALSLCATSSPLPLHHGGVAAPRAWVAASGGQLWVCWDGPLTDAPAKTGCWDRLPLELARDAPLDPDRNLRFGFRDTDSLWIHAPRGGTWIIGRDGIATMLEDAPTGAELSPLLSPSCSPSGWLPTRTEGRWGWRAAPCSEPATCQERPRIRRKPTGIRASLFIETTVRRRTLGASEGARAQLDGQALLSLRVGLDRRRAHSDRRAIARWHRAADEQRRRLPAPRTSGPLGERERLALERGQCRAWGEIR